MEITENQGILFWTESLYHQGKLTAIYKLLQNVLDSKFSISWTHVLISLEKIKKYIQIYF